MTTIETQPTRACYHGGAFWDELGDDMAELHLRDRIIAADVLDAWFDPSPRVIQRVTECLPFALRASPPTNAAGMERVIAEHRGVPADSVLAGAGSSDLIFAGLRKFIDPGSRVLILDPMYGEYAHVLEAVIGARVDRLALDRGANFDVPIDALRRMIAAGYDWVVLVNPNSPTGRHTDGRALMSLAAAAPAGTRFWIDETYIDYVNPRASVERFAVQTHNVVVCKSMSKAYALSGARAAYLCGAPDIIDELRPISPPWSVSLPGQIAAIEALRDLDYYAARWRETAELRVNLEADLRELGCDVVPGCANFLLCELPAAASTAMEVGRRARERGLLIRDVGNMGQRFGPRAFRIAVKDARTNARMIRILDGAVIHESFDVAAVYGHIVPGLLFVFWGLLWFRRARRGESPFGAPAERWIVAAAAVFGVIIELGYTGWVLSDRSVMNYQHSTMYVAFALPAMLNVWAQQGRVTGRLPFATLAAAFGIGGMLFVAHGNPNVVSEAVHVLMACIFFAAGLMTALEARGPATPSLGFARSWFTIALGIWFLAAAWILGASGYDLQSTAVVLRVRLFFIWDVGGTGLVLALLPQRS